MNLASAAILALAMPTDAFAAAVDKGASLQETRWSQALQTGAIFGVIEARLLRSDLPCLAAMAAFGAVLGLMSPIWGLQHTSGTNTSLMLTLEAVFTAILACCLYQETMDRHVCSQTSIRTCMTMAKPRTAICPAQIRTAVEATS